MSGNTVPGTGSGNSAMEIYLKRINASHHELSIVRTDKTTEHIMLNTKTYLLHDVCHFYVEQILEIDDGFWGMLAQGYRIEQLSGKTNQLTEQLRLIECIVGGVQSVYSKHMDQAGFWNYMQTVDYDIADTSFLEKVIPQINKFMNRWNYLPAGQTVTLNF